MFEGALLLLVPRLGVPAPFVFGLFNEANVGIAFNAAGTALDEFSIGGGPMRGKYVDGLGAVAGEPSCLHFAGGHTAGEHDLEGTLAEFEAEFIDEVHSLTFRNTHFIGGVDEAVCFVNLPV